MKNKTTTKLLYGIVGIAMIAAAVVLQIHADFGLDSLNALYGNLSLITGYSFGFFSVCIGFFFILANTIISKKSFNFGALMIAFLIGGSVNFFSKLFSPYFSTISFEFRILLFVVGILIYGVGIAFLIFSRMPSPLEEWQFAVQILTSQSVANSKMIADLTLFVFALIVGFTFHIGFGQIQIGTLLITLSIGRIIGFTLQMLKA